MTRGFQAAAREKPILVMMSWRGGDRLARCLASLPPALRHFSRVVLSITAASDSADMRMAEAFKAAHPIAEVICTGAELPTMDHQAFWVDYLQRTGASPDTWIYWLAYDDEVRARGIEAVVDEHGRWPLRSDTVYFGPWAMRHEDPDRLWSGDPHAVLESWTSFRPEGPLRVPVMHWVAEQLRQPTYMQMSGSLCPLRNFIELRDGRPRKTGPMRIEMAVAAGSRTTHVAELPEPVSIIYGRANSDRASYGSAARAQDAHLVTWLARHAARHPAEIPSLAGILARQSAALVSQRLGSAHPAQEEWRVRGTVTP